MTRRRTFRNVAAWAALVPTWAMVLVGYVGTIAWTIQISTTNSKSLPGGSFVGLAQYKRLFADDRWQISVENIILFGVMFILLCLVIGFLLAVAIDQKIRGEDVVRTIVLYPYAMSFVVTGLVWQWMMNPTLGVQNSIRALGWESFTFDWVVRPEMAIYALVLAAVWQSSGLVMAILLAGLRGIDQELWKAARVDGIPAWRFYASIVVPQLRPMVITCVVLLSIGVVKSYDLVISLTRGGPGLSTEVPAKFVMDYLFQRANIGLATSASTVMLITVMAFLAPYLYLEYFRKQGAAR